MRSKIILADDHQIVREGLRTLLEKQPNVDVIGEASTGREAVRMTREMSPDIVIMDIGMQDLNGIEATRQIIAEFPNIKVIALSMHSDRRFISGMLGVGASGYLLKDCAFEELADALGTVLSGKIYLSPTLATTVIRDCVPYLSQKGLSVFSVLTAREREVLQLLTEGHSTKEIAATLHVSVKTIETHRQHIMEKLGINSIAELTKYAIREGLTSLEG